MNRFHRVLMILNGFTFAVNAVFGVISIILQDWIWASAQITIATLCAGCVLIQWRNWRRDLARQRDFEAQLEAWVAAFEAERQA